MSMMLDPILLHAPCAIFWKDLNGTFLGCNKLFLTMSGLNDYNELIGKKDADMRWKQYAYKYTEDDKYVIDTGKMITSYENIPVGDRIIISETTKAPLIENGKIIGVVGICLDITDRKEAERLRIEVERKEIERLKLENEAHKAHIEEQKKFTKIADQVAHDIRAPAGAVLSIARNCMDIPEDYRISLREAAISIDDIVNNLLHKYEKKDAEGSAKDVRQSVLLSVLLSQLLARKKLEYKGLTIKFDYEFSQAGNFAFIKVQPSALERSISNIINNAVDALKDKEKGKITIKLDTTQEWVKIIIQDNGKGMSPEIVEKIMNGVAVSHGKENGHGIGLSVVREMLQANQGKFTIDSKVNKGTNVILTFPRIKAPSLIVEEIRLVEKDIVVILDDDTSIHGAWDAHFENVLKDTSGIEIKHFKQGKEALDYINGLSDTDKRRVFLLTDFELLKQELNGLQIVEKSRIERSILVTSHYANKDVQTQAIKTGTKILSKQLASEVPIIIDKNIQYEASIPVKLKKVDIILIDDDEKFAQVMMLTVFSGLEVEHYVSPTLFLKHVAKYAKDTKICLDKNFSGDMDGMELAKNLHEQGFTKLFLVSGETFDEGAFPGYITIVPKMNIGKVKDL